MGITTGRMHHFLSDQERNYFYIVEFEDSIVDIREQFPLLPIEQTIAIAEDLGIEHPKDPKTQDPIVMTTDFVITFVRDNKPMDVARTIKMKDDLMSERTIEKFEIERRYWALKEISWGIVTNEEINKTLAFNISAIHSSFNLSDNDGLLDLPEHVPKLISQFKNLIVGEKVTVRDKTSAFDEKMELEPGTSLSIFKHLLITKQIRMDLITKKLNFNRPVTIALYHEVSKGEYAV